MWIAPKRIVVNCFQIRNFVTSNNVEMQNAIEKEL